MYIKLIEKYKGMKIVKRMKTKMGNEMKWIV
jgi:hypothetical protein